MYCCSPPPPLHNPIQSLPFDPTVERYGTHSEVVLRWPYPHASDECLRLCWHLQIAYLALVLEWEGDDDSFSSSSQSCSHDSVVSVVARVDDMDGDAVLMSAVTVEGQ